MALSTTAIWVIVGIVILILGSAVITLAVLLVERARGNAGPSAFTCSVATPGVFPDCGTQVTISGIPGPLGSGFFTSKKITPTYKAPQTLNPNQTLQLTGYYYAHPTGYYKISPGGALYSYPFILELTASGSPTLPPTFHLAGYRYAPEATEVEVSPFEQFSFLATGLDRATNGYTMTLPCAIGTTPEMPNFVPDFEVYPANGGPTLTSVLSSTQGSPGTRKVRVITTQGTPYVVVTLADLNSTGQVPFLSIDLGAIGSHSVEQIVVSNPPSRTFNAYFFWSSRGGAPQKCMVWFIDAATPQSLSINAGVATLNVQPQAIAYISMFAQVGPLLSMVVNLIASSLIPHYIQLTDIIPSGDNTAMQYTLAPLSGYTLSPGSSTLWIVPPTAFRTAALASVTLPGTTYLDFPIGNGIFQTNPQVGPAVYTSFFTLWPSAGSQISDFTSYTLPNSGSGLTDTVFQAPSDADLYYLALAIRVMSFTAGCQPATDVQKNTCVTDFSQKVNAMGVGLQDHTLYTPNLGSQDAGLVSRVSNLLLTFLHLNAIKGLLPITQSNNGLIVNAGPQLTMMVESGLTTASLTSQQGSLGVSLYTPLAFLDAYSCTIPTIKTAGLSVPPVPTPAQLTSRLGETLGYLWACDWLVSNGFVSAAQGIPFFARSLYAMVLESTTRLLRGQCTTSSTPSLSPVMPWTSNVSQTAFGFQLDGASPGGNSPDATLLQSFTPFSPPTHISIRPLLSPLTIAVEKLLKCTQGISQAPPSQYFFGGFVDPTLVGYFTYLYTSGDRTHMLLSGKPDEDMKPFVKNIEVQHPAVALFMNQVKLGLTSQAIVTRF